MIQKNLIYFGNSENSINPDCYKNPNKKEYLDFLEQNKRYFELDNLIFPKQTHGISGIILTNKNLPTKTVFNTKLPKSWKIESDYLITDLKNIGIGVLTADCLPIIIIDDKISVVAVIHAGWRGTVSGIIEDCVNNLINNFGSKPENLKAYLGPCAKSCCYEVQEDFVNNLKEHILSSPLVPSVFRSLSVEKCISLPGEALREAWEGSISNKIYFDLPKLAQIKLENLGLKPENINLENNICTMCNPQFCSYRNNKNCNRQISIVAIKK